LSPGPPGAHAIAAPPERAYALLQNPAVLASCMPGCDALEPAGDGEYRMKMKMTLASMAGMFDGTVKMAGARQPGSFRQIVEGAGRIGFMKGDGVLTLVETAGGTECVSMAAWKWAVPLPPWGSA